MCGTLILVCGLPGAGKSTYARRLVSERGAIGMVPDEWIEAVLANPLDIAERDRLRDPIEDLQWDLAQRYLSLGHTVVLEFGFWSDEERSQIAVQALELGARIELVYMEAPDFDDLWERIQRRNERLSGGPWVMSREDLLRAWELFVAPTEDEGAFYDEFTIVRLS